jgi:DNA polymerase-3 subunit delta
MQQLRHQLEQDRTPVRTLVANIRLPLHFSRKRALERSLPIWNASAISRALSRMDQAALECRAKPLLGPSLAGTAMLAIAVEARQKMNRNQGDYLPD